MTLLAEPRRGMPSIDDTVFWGKYKGTSYRELAARDPGYARWAAMTIGGLKGQLCAEALAIVLGVSDVGSPDPGAQNPGSPDPGAPE